MAARQVFYVEDVEDAHTLQTTQPAVRPSVQPEVQPAGATFDLSGRYRYTLWRVWDFAAPRVAFVMLNPSTADAERNDPTIRRCIGLAKAWGYGGLEVVNLFAYRATRPQDLKRVDDPIGEAGDRPLIAAAEQAAQIILAWGNGGALYQRDRAVLALLSGYPLHCLGLTQQQQPRHPLYVPSGTVPIRYSPHSECTQD
ncbi:DUF1643 domain-containing protein [Thermoleptolyngbya oregonensis NK1-22]|uniref:DUF1643 domain-containing protein n=1 Tax=Thermoleptolyngbya oregonensis NK1-22 TaxID=2547457 RepID=A0AA96YL10_9CYAN|nr:DUF1643 domain-containing protein [Thermoleptolyngbya oregonensis]WOB42127.1 DUF1643 domain-containing protein [Thermoleptolyngbya oregonensis NK1-22]